MRNITHLRECEKKFDCDVIIEFPKMNYKKKCNYCRR